MMSRAPAHVYRDPLDRIWLSCVERLGFRVERRSDVNAATDGRGTIFVGTQESLDPDDCLAQVLLHELCHAIVEGPGSRDLPDWGLDNLTDRDVPREHACLRLQAALTWPHGLRRVLAPTTDFRAFYDALPADPLEDVADETVRLARRGSAAARGAPWSPHLEVALAATAAIARTCAPFANLDGAETGLRCLWSELEEPAPRHASGIPMAREGSVAAGRTCATCAWLYTGGQGRPVTRCRQAGGARVDPSDAACERWEDTLECATCGACCRGAYDSVAVGAHEPVRMRHPHLVEVRAGLAGLRRSGDRCAALAGAGSVAEPHACVIYADRPRACRELEIGGANCLDARQRVGLGR